MAKRDARWHHAQLMCEGAKQLSIAVTFEKTNTFAILGCVTWKQLRIFNDRMSSYAHIFASVLLSVSCLCFCNGVFAASRDATDDVHTNRCKSEFNGVLIDTMRAAIRKERLRELEDFEIELKTDGWPSDNNDELLDAAEHFLDQILINTENVVKKKLALDKSPMIALCERWLRESAGLTEEFRGYIQSQMQSVSRKLSYINVFIWRKISFVTLRTLVCFLRFHVPQRAHTEALSLAILSFCIHWRSRRNTPFVMPSMKRRPRKWHTMRHWRDWAALNRHIRLFSNTCSALTRRKVFPMQRQ